MFCADYLSAYLFHSSLKYFLLQQKNDDWSKFWRAHPYLGGTLAGVMGSITVYPFDFVRKGVVVGQKVNFLHRFSSVPYATVYFGLYFHMRDPTSTKSQSLWALASSFGGALAEIPLDKSKLLMLGSRKMMVLTSFLYAPFGAFMLIMYDKALTKFGA